jgi:hypothetical protein
LPFLLIILTISSETVASLIGTVTGMQDFPENWEDDENVTAALILALIFRTFFVRENLAEKARVSASPRDGIIHPSILGENPQNLEGAF